MLLDSLYKTGMLIPIYDFLGKNERRLRAQLMSFVWVYNICCTDHVRDCLVEQGSLKSWFSTPHFSIFLYFCFSVLLPLLTFTLLPPPFLKIIVSMSFSLWSMKFSGLQGQKVYQSFLLPQTWQIKSTSYREHCQSHYLKPPSPWYQNQTKTPQKRKLQANIFDEYRCKNP